ncbi:MAG: tyrosine-type recombinase/integrase [Bacteroidia bacterium]
MKHLPLNNAEFEHLYKEFDGFIKFKGYARGQGGSYASNVREFLFFIENRGVDDIKKVVALDVIQYHEYLKERPNNRRTGGLSESMIGSHLFALRLFFDYLMDMGEVTASPAHLPKLKINKSQPRDILTIPEIKEVNQKCQTKLETALIAIAYGCGLRRTEIELLDVGDVLLNKGVLIVREGKGGKSRTVPLSDGGVKTLKEYVTEERPLLFPDQGMQSCPAFFINRNGTRMTGDQLNDIAKELVARTQNPAIISKNITLHCLRHSIATHLLDSGAEIEFVQELLGHEELDTSTLYSKHRKQRMALYKQINRPTYGHN